MSCAPSPPVFASCWFRFPIRFTCSLALTLGSASPLAAQDAVQVDAVAGVLQSEDARRYVGPVLENAARHPDPLVRRVTARAMGRIGDRVAIPQLLELLEDPDSLVQATAAFSLGLLGDSSVLPRLRDLALNTPDLDQHDAHEEAVTAIAKIGGPDAAAIFLELLSRWAPRAASAAPPATVIRAVEEAWRLGADAPAEQLIEFTVSPVRAAKIGAVYSLARLGTPQASDVLLAATGSGELEVRMYAVRALTAAYADSAGLDPTALGNRVRRLVSDPEPHVRINAMRALSSYRDSSFAPAVTDRLSDTDANVRVQAVSTLADLGGSLAVEALAAQVGKSPFAVRRQALIGFAQLAGVDALTDIGGWLIDEAWPARAAGAEALGYIAQDTVVPWLVHMTRDPDPRVVHTALASLSAVAPEAATERARRLVQHADPVVRAVAADRLGSVPDTADLDRLTLAYRSALEDSIPDAQIAILGAVGRIAELGVAERIAVEDRFLARFQPNDDYVVRRAVATRFPEAARRWGDPSLIETGLGLEDYRDIARRYLVPGGSGERRMVIETPQGTITLQLFTADAPITIAMLWQLVDQRYFDGTRWHRVVPNFVVQGGDPRGDGWGGPGYAMRDEINRHRYSRGMVGIALSGPDTGGSQFFITHSPQPHLDGTYTVIGRVQSGMDVVDLITQGDRVRRVRRP